MKQLIFKLVIYCFVVSVLLVGMFFITGKLTVNHRLGTTYLKQDRLSSIEGRKIILVGGSNLHYGINSKLLEEELGIAVANMGLQGSIGLEYYFNEIMDKVQENDIVILLGEPGLYHKIDTNGEQTLYNLISKYPKGIKYLNKYQIINSPKYIGVAINENFKYFLTLISAKLQNLKTTLEQTNTWGDYEGHKGMNSTYTAKKLEPIDFQYAKKRIKHTISFLQNTEREITSRGAHFFIGFAPTAKSIERDDIFRLIDEATTDAFSDTKLGSMTEYVMPDEYFFDTSHHLLYKMRDKRTKMVINNIMNNQTTADIIQRLNRH